MLASKYAPVTADPLGLMAGLFLGPIAWNVCYCLGPITDCFLYFNYKKPFSDTLMKLGVAFSAAIIYFPLVVWTIAWLFGVATDIIKWQ